MSRLLIKFDTPTTQVFSPEIRHRNDAPYRQHGHAHSWMRMSMLTPELKKILMISGGLLLLGLRLRK